MECKGIKAIFAVAAILVLLVGQSSASQCYDQCLDECLFFNNTLAFCVDNCLQKCGGQNSAAEVGIGCSSACAKSSCGQLVREGNDMGACLSACSKSCTKARKSL